MTEEKIQFTIGGKYTAGETFKQLNGDVKQMQRSAKDAIGGLTSMASQAANVLDDKLAGSIKNVTGLLSNLGRGGVIGAVATAATAATTYIIKAYQEHRKAIEEVHERLLEMNKAYNNFITIQLQAKEAVEQNRLEAIVEKAKEAVAQVERLQSAMKNLAASEDAQLGSSFNLKIAKINEEFSAKLNEACKELQPVVNAEKNLAIALERQESARVQQERAVEREKVALLDVEQQIKLQKKVIEAQNVAGEDIKKSYEKLNALQIERSAVLNRLAAAETNAEASAIEHKTAVQDATSALEKANESWDRVVEENERLIDAQDSLAQIEEKLRDLKQKEYDIKKSGKDALDQNSADIKQAQQQLNDAKTHKAQTDKGVAAYNYLHNLSPKDFKYGLDGQLLNPTDAAQASRAYRNETAKQDARRERALDNMRKKAEAAEQVPEDKRNPYQKKAIEDYKDAQKYYNGEKNARDKLDMLETQRDSLRQQMSLDLSNIANEVQNLTNIKIALENQGLK